MRQTLFAEPLAGAGAVTIYHLVVCLCADETLEQYWFVSTSAEKMPQGTEYVKSKRWNRSDL